MDWMKASVVSGGETIGVVRVPVLGVPRVGEWVSVGGQAHRIVRVEHGDMCVVLDVTPDVSAAAALPARVTKGE